MPMKLDEVFSDIGDNGRGQLLIFFIICSIGQLPASWHIFAIVFLGATPDHICQTASVDTEWHFIDSNFSQETAKCEDSGANSSFSCENGWIYSDEPYGSTIVSQWDLICDRVGYVEFSQAVLMAGVIVGSYLAGYLADRFGRKPIMFVSFFLQGIVGIIQAYSSSFTMFIIIRFVIGILDQGYELPVYTMVSELFTPRWRPYTFICMMNFWAAGILSLPLIAYFIRDWRYLQLAISIPFLLFPIFYWVIPESPRWLLSVGRYDEATAIVKSIAKFNGKGHVRVNFSPEESDQMQTKESMIENREYIDIHHPSIINHPSSATEERKQEGYIPSQTYSDSKKETNTVLICDNDHKANLSKYTAGSRQKNGHVTAISNSYLELFNGYKMSLVTVIMCIAWFVIAFSYYGLSFNAGRIVGDPYLNFFLTGAVEIPSHLLATGIVVWFGRRWPICIFLLVTGIASVSVSFIPEGTATGEDLTTAIVTTAMIGKFSIASAYAIVCLYASEIFPTVIRNKGIGLVAIAARVGALLAPFVLLLESSFPKAPMILFGTVAIIPGLLVLLIPEMKGRHQPQTIADLEALFGEDKQRRQSNKSKRVRNHRNKTANTIV